MKILLIAGPASSTLDQARVITNRSSGRTGVIVAGILKKHNLSPILWLGKGATAPLPAELSASARFGTVQELETLLAADLSSFKAILLPAALPDYRLKRATGLDGKELDPHKWPGSLPKIHLELVPGPRILPTLRAKAPQAKIVGWKWEADGSLEELMTTARRQIRDCQTDACVLNGPAYGVGYLLIPACGEPVRCSDAAELGHALVRFLQEG